MRSRSDLYELKPRLPKVQEEFISDSKDDMTDLEDEPEEETRAFLQKVWQELRPDLLY